MGIALFKLENCRLLRAVQRQQPCRSGRICGTGITGTGEDVHVSSCGEGIFLTSFSIVMRPFVVGRLSLRARGRQSFVTSGLFEV